MIQYYSVHVCRIKCDPTNFPVSIFICKVYNRNGSIIADPQIAFYKESDAIRSVIYEMDKLGTPLIKHNCRIDCSIGKYIIDDDGKLIEE